MLKSKFRVYAALEPGALLVRQCSSPSLGQALNKVAKVANAVAWEIREFRNGTERLIPVETKVLQ